MDRKYNVYLSSPMTYVNRLYDIVNIISKKNHVISSSFNFCVPVVINDSKFNSYVYMDIKRLDESDILISHIPEPSVGSCAELGYFKAKHPNGLIIAYKCIKHPWIESLSSYQVDKIDDIVDILETYVLSHI